ncbi:MAG: hypothetical protein OYH76_22695 [Defluviicoccus sp.]|nr:hypothetical protein [Defluviicoccus sp.]MDE0278714.1 hypothetical protein [Defluviicoccus sp.]
MAFALPESYRAYCTDTAVRTAVDHILASTDRKGALSVPSEIDWDDLPAFHRAVLSAHQVRCEFSVFLIDLWDAVWQRALDEGAFDSGRDDWTVSQTEEWSGEKLDTHTVWGNGWFGRVFAIGGGDLQLGLAVQHPFPEEVKLGLCLWGADDTDRTTGRDFGDEWAAPDEERWIYTDKDLAPIRDDGTMDLDRLHTAAVGALSAIGNDAQG